MVIIYFDWKQLGSLEKGRYSTEHVEGLEVN